MKPKINYEKYEGNADFAIVQIDNANYEVKVNLPGLASMDKNIGMMKDDGFDVRIVALYPKINPDAEGKIFQAHSELNRGERKEESLVTLLEE